MDQTESAANLSFQLAFGIIGMILLAVFIVIFFIVYQRKLFQQQLQFQQLQSSYQKELLYSGILAQEKERARIAVDLHDSIGGLLSAAKLYVSNVNQQLPVEKFELFKAKALEVLNENISEVRDITNDLLPQSLEHLGVFAAIRKLTQKLKDLEDIESNYIISEEQRFNQDQEKSVFRIMQELINNTLKHANATKVDINFRFEGPTLAVSYKDNGVGFDKQVQADKQKDKGYGLKSIEGRIAFLEGQLDLQTAPNAGVEIYFTFPVKPV